MPRLLAPTRRATLVLVSLTASAGLAAGCSSTPSKGAHNRHHTNTKPSTTPTTGTFGTAPQNSTPSATATTPLQLAGVSVVLNGSVAEIDFTPPAVTGAPTASGASLSNGGKTLAFSITGVTYKGGDVTTAGVPTNQIGQVHVSSAKTGVSVIVTMNKAASQYKFKSGNDKVTVTVS
jgi:hypothetical protein